MKTMRAKSILGAAVVFLAICSCDKSEFTVYEGKSSSKPIMIGKVEVGAPLTKSDVPESSKVGEVNDGNVSFTVTETVSTIEPDYQTKAIATTTANLGSFKVYGYLDPEIKDKEGASDEDKNNLYFIKGAEAEKNSIQNSKWWGDFGTTYNWRFGIHHHFWATPNNLSLSINQDTFNSASFSYTSNGSEDVVIAYSKQYFGKDEETAMKDSTMHLTFKHALAAVKINSEDLVFLKRKSGETDEPVGYYPSNSTTPRCEILKYEVRGLMNRGDCAVDSTTTFTWGNHSSSVNPAVVNLLADNEPQFLIPQDRSGALLHLEIIDRQRQLTRPFVYELKNVFGTSEWLAGYQYNYKLEGRIVVPKLPEGQEGIDAGFAGKDFQSLALIEGLAGKYIKKVKITWTGLPGGNSGNGTFVWISLENSNYTPLESDYMGSGQTPITARPQIGFVYDYKTSSVIKGTVDGTTCSCEITIDENASDLNLYAVYIGANNSGTCEWILHGLKMEVLEWR